MNYKILEKVLIKNANKYNQLRVDQIKNKIYISARVSDDRMADAAVIDVNKNLIEELNPNYLTSGEVLEIINFSKQDKVEMLDLPVKRTFYLNNSDYKELINIINKSNNDSLKDVIGSEINEK